MNVANNATASADHPTRQGLKRDSVGKSTTSNLHHVKVGKELNIATYNVRTLRDGFLDLLEENLENYQWDVMGLCETRRVGQGEENTTLGNLFVWSGQQSKRRHGVGFLINKRIKSCVLEVNAISDRIMYIRLNAKPRNISMFQVYAPTSDADDDVVQEWYDSLESAMDKISKKDIMIVQGDFNAKIGRDAYINFSGFMGAFANKSGNERGEEMLHFMEKHNLFACNTKFQHKRSRTITWYSPDGRSGNQIDYTLISAQWKRFIIRSRVYPGIDIGSDHRALITSIKFCYANHIRKVRRPSMFTRESIEEKEADFKTAIDCKLENVDEGSLDINAKEEYLGNIILSTANEVLEKRKFRKYPWISDHTIALTAQRHEARRNNQKSLRNKLNREISRSLRKDKESWIQSKCSSIDLDIKRNHTKQAFETINSLTKPSSSNCLQINDSNGTTLSDKNEILGRWKEYCQLLYEVKQIRGPPSLENALIPINDAVIPPPSLTEVETALNSLKNDKSPGIDGIQSDLLKIIPDSVTSAYHDLILNIWEKEIWPTRWCQSIVVPIHKKGSKAECTNYRTISLTAHPSKVLLKILQSRLLHYSDDFIEKEQAGFKKGSSTVDQIFILNQVKEKYLEMNRQIWNVFIDFEKAFDSIDHDILWRVCAVIGLPHKYINLIKSLYLNAECFVRINSNLSDSFKPRRGVRQGCILSPLIFNMFLQHVINESGIINDDHGIRIQGLTINYLAYADDIDIMTDNRHSCMVQTQKLSSKAAEYGLDVSKLKTEVMISTKQAVAPANISIQGGFVLKETKSFKYLGQIIQSDGHHDNEIKKRCACAMSALNRLFVLWKVKKLSVKTKLRIYQSLVLSVLTYGCETWPLTTLTKRTMNAFEMKCLRKILNINYQQHITNEEVVRRIRAIHTTFVSLRKTIIKRQLQWLGHVIRKSPDELTKVALFGLVEGSRPRGRPRDTWLNLLLKEADLTRAQARERACDRLKWKEFIREITV